MKVNGWLETVNLSLAYIFFTVQVKKRQHKSILVKLSIYLCFSTAKNLICWDFGVCQYICERHVFLITAFRFNAELPLASEVKAFAYYTDFSHPQIHFEDYMFTPEIPALEPS